MTYYLQYRPQTIAALDLASVRRELGMILSSGRFAHAYLFAGPRGTGKTSAARILAKVVNCERNSPSSKTTAKQATRRKARSKLSEPCNKCNLCRAITSGTALDLFEIDAASNRGIDDIRELRERIKLAPAEAAYKVYIIDEVHMLTVEAFNALLKTLEEPPRHALFVLCTTEPQKLPETVISRCTRIAFPKASEEEVISSLRKVVKGEKLRVKPGVLEAIAQAVDGSFRDGMKFLEQLSLRLSEKKPKHRLITLADVYEVTGLSEGDAARRMVTLLVAGDIKRAFSLIAEVSKNQSSLEQYVRQILELLRRLLLSEVGVFDEEKIEGLDLEGIRRLIALFTRAAHGLRTAVILELPLELAVVEWMENGKREGDSHKTIPSKSPAAPDIAFGSVKGGRATRMRSLRAGEPAANKPSFAQRTPRGELSKSDVSFSQVQKSWPKILEKVRPQNHSVAALLKAATPKELTDDWLIVEVAYPFHKEQLELTRYASIVEAAVTNVLSVRLKLRYVLRKYQKQTNVDRKGDHENINGAVEDEAVVRAAEEIFGTKSE